MVLKRMVAGITLVAAGTTGGLVMTASPALAKPGPPVTVITTDAPPPGGKATYDPANRRLTMCDNETDIYAVVARLRVDKTQRTVPVGRGCHVEPIAVPPNTTVSLQVCLSNTATGSGPLEFCSAWKSTST